jgi:hypothetical protein
LKKTGECDTKYEAMTLKDNQGPGLEIVCHDLAVCLEFLSFEFLNTFQGKDGYVPLNNTKCYT